MGVATLYTDLVSTAKVALQACGAFLCTWALRVEAATLGWSTTRKASPARLRCKLALIASRSRLPRLNTVRAVSINSIVYPSLLQTASDVLLAATFKIIVKVALAATLNAHLTLNRWWNPWRNHVALLFVDRLRDLILRVMRRCLFLPIRVLLAHFLLL